MTTRRALWLIIGGFTALRLLASASLGAAFNETYYWLYSNHLAPGYFDHPPMLAFVGAVGLKLAGGVDSMFALRLGFIALFGASTWLLARITARSFGAWAGVFAAFALNATGFYGLVVGTYSQPDGPLLFFWLLVLDRLSVALEKPERLAPWIMIGIAWGAALLSKYHAVLLPAGVVLYLAIRPEARRCLRTPGPYLAAVLGLLVFSPVIFWNATHGWASFAFQGGRAVESGTNFRPERIVLAIGGEALFLFPWIWIPLIVCLYKLLRRGPNHRCASEAFLLSQAAPALILFHAIAAVRWVMPHWPLIGYVSLLPLLGREWSELRIARPAILQKRLIAFAIAPVVLTLLVVVQSQTQLFLAGNGKLFGLIAPQDDPTVDQWVWNQVSVELDRRGLLYDPKTFLFTNSWQDAARLSFAARDKARVACYVRDARSFAFWSATNDWVGQDGIYIGNKWTNGELRVYRHFFDRVEAIGAFNVERAGRVVKDVVLYRCTRQTRPFPFDNRHDNMALYFDQIGDPVAARDIRDLYGEGPQKQANSTTEDNRNSPRKR
ncbi:MAG: hypothetical protein NVSMB14_00550 [Isosphaeraceae bacterium]